MPTKNIATSIPIDNERSDRDPGEASESAVRKILVLIELLRTKAIRFSTYERVYARDFRSYQRDLQHLRKIGEEAGFKISPIRGKERAELTVFDAQLRSLDASPQVLGLLGAIGGALGPPVARELGRLAGPSGEDGFLRILVPQLVEQSQIGETYDRLKSAWQVRPGPAVVTFAYDPGKGNRTERRVEPYRILIRSGSSFLVGYDIDKRDWRLFALDRICTPPERAGTVQRLRTVPPAYDSTDTVGFFKSAAAVVTVTVELTPAVAASATSRRWQAAQKVEPLPDGRARISFEVTEIGEVVRWALGFGNDAKIVAPPAAVELAKKTIAEISATYAGYSSGDPTERRGSGARIRI